MRCGSKNHSYPARIVEICIELETSPHRNPVAVRKENKARL